MQLLGSASSTWRLLRRGTTMSRYSPKPRYQLPSPVARCLPPGTAGQPDPIRALPSGTGLYLRYRRGDRPAAASRLLGLD